MSANTRNSYNRMNGFNMVKILKDYNFKWILINEPHLLLCGWQMQILHFNLSAPLATNPALKSQRYFNMIVHHKCCIN